MALPEEKLFEFPLVGIGASAGGITAIQSLLQALGDRASAAIVIIQHLPPGKPSGLSRLLRKWTALPVHEALDGIQPAPGNVYLPAPQEVLTMEGGVFRTRPLEGGARRPGIDTIDAFFESLAAQRGPSAVAVVLSGTGMDGTAGAVRIRQAGGMVLVQEPSTALYDGMPSSVIARGAAQLVLPISAIADELIAMGSPEYGLGPDSAAWRNETSHALDEILALIRGQAGFDLSSYKPSPVLWRVQQRMDARGTRRFADYEALLKDDPAELETLVNGLPIHVTEFFRDPEAWQVLDEEAIRAFDATRPLRAWTTACATGEEAYSLAMLLAERCAADAAAQFQVFATDASPEIVARASRGVFTEDAVRGVSPERRQRYFYRADGNWRVKRQLRERMVFAPHDLLVDPPFTDLDLITCRNLLIYLEPDAILQVLALLHGALREGGYLFLGRGEPLSPRQKGLEAVSSKWHIYRKTQGLGPIKARFSRHLPRIRHAAAVPSAAHHAAIENRQLPSVLVDESFAILRVYGDTSAFLRIPAGHPTSDLLKIAHPRLVPHLRTASRHTLAGSDTFSIDIPAGNNGEPEVCVRFTRMRTGDDGSVRRYLVSFVAAERRRARDAETLDAANEQWGEAMQASREELDASREELQALNEELKASNEQLNLSNEDLNRSNVELEQKIAQLEMQSRVLSSGAVATLFLDEEKRIRWFTPAVGDLFPLGPGDEGRPLTDLAPRFDDPAFFDDVDFVMRTGEASEAEVRARSGRWWLRRIRPFMSREHAIAGVAAIFTDITDGKRAAEAIAQDLNDTHLLRDLALRQFPDDSLQTAYQDVLSAAVAITRADAGSVQMVDDETGDLVLLAWHGISDEMKRRFFRLPNASSTPCGVALANGARVFMDFDAPGVPDPKGDLRVHVEHGLMSAQSTPLVTRAGKLIGMISTHWRRHYRPSERELRFLDLLGRQAADLIDRTRAASALHESEEKYRSLFNSIDEGFCIIEVIFDAAGKAVDYRFIEVNPIFEKLTGIVAAPGRRMREISPEHEEQWFEIYGRVAMTGEPIRFEHRAGQDRLFDLYAFRVGEPERRRVAVLFTDISERKRAEEVLRASERKYRASAEALRAGPR